MWTKSWKSLARISLMVVWAFNLNSMPSSLAATESDQKTQMEPELVLPGEQIVLGIVQDVKADVIQVNIGQLEPVNLPLRAAEEKGIHFVLPGDTLKIIVNNQNQVIDFHKADDPQLDRSLKGHLLQPLMGDHQWAVIQTEKGTKETYEVDEKARHTVMNIPVGVPAAFLLNRENILIDATFGDEEALLHTLAEWSKDRQRGVHY